MTDHLTILVSECRLYPDGEDDPLLAPPIGGPGIPGMFGTEFTGRASSTLQQIASEREREREKQGDMVKKYDKNYRLQSIISYISFPSFENDLQI